MNLGNPLHKLNPLCLSSFYILIFLFLKKLDLKHSFCFGGPLAFEHEPGTAIECLSIPIILHKETGLDQDGRQVILNGQSCEIFWQCFFTRVSYGSIY